MSKSKVIQIGIIALLSASNTWALDCKQAAHAPKHGEPSESIRTSGKLIKIQGRSLLSFADDSVFIQSENHFMQVRRDSIKSIDLAKVDSPGSRLDLSIPREGLLYAWTVDFGDSDLVIWNCRI